MQMNKQVSALEDYRLIEELSGGEYLADAGLFVWCRTAWDEQLQAGRSSILLKNLASGEEQMLTAGGTTETSPRFRPDGKSVSFLSNAEGGMQIWCTSLETGECRKITAVPGGVTSPLWSGKYPHPHCRPQLPCGGGTGDILLKILGPAPWRNP